MAKTVRSIGFEPETYRALDEYAQALGMSFSAALDTVLREQRQGLAQAARLMREAAVEAARLVGVIDWRAAPDFEQVLYLPGQEIDVDQYDTAQRLLYLRQRAWSHRRMAHRRIENRGDLADEETT